MAMDAFGDRNHCRSYGVAVAGSRSLIVAEPVLGWRYYGPIEGRIIEIDRSQSEKPRITLDRVRLARVSPARTPTHGSHFSALP